MNPLVEVLKKHVNLKKFTIIDDINSSQGKNKLEIIIPRDLVINKINQDKTMTIVVPNNQDYTCEMEKLFNVLDTFNCTTILHEKYLINFTYNKELVRFSGFDDSKNLIQEIDYKIKLIRRSGENN